MVTFETIADILVYVVFAATTVFFCYIAYQSFNILKNYPHVRRNFVLVMLFISSNCELLTWIVGMTFRFMKLSDFYLVTTIIEDAFNNIVTFSLFLRIVETLNALDVDEKYIRLKADKGQALYPCLIVVLRHSKMNV